MMGRSLSTQKKNVCTYIETFQFFIHSRNFIFNNILISVFFFCELNIHLMTIHLTFSWSFYAKILCTGKKIQTTYSSHHKTSSTTTTRHKKNRIIFIRIIYLGDFCFLMVMNTGLIFMEDFFFRKSHQQTLQNPCSSSGAGDLLLFFYIFNSSILCEW